MRSMFRSVLVASLAVFAVSAVASASALAAPEWKIGGAAFPGEETLKTKIVSASFTFESKVGAETIIMTCTGVSTTHAEIFNSTEDWARSINFTGCKVLKPSTCTMAAELKTEAVLTKLVEEGGKIYDLYTPTSGMFIEIKLGVCALAGTYKVKGTARQEVGSEAVCLESKFTSASGTRLTWSGEPFTLTGTTCEELTGPNAGTKWAA